MALILLIVERVVYLNGEHLIQKLEFIPKALLMVLAFCQGSMACNHEDKKLEKLPIKLEYSS